MTLDEAIKHCEEVAEKYCEVVDDEFLRQLAEWLKELKEYKEERVTCEFCKYQDRKEHERPCSLCCHNFMDMFESEVNADG